MFTSRSFKFVMVAVAVAGAAVLGTQGFRTIYTSGYQRGADSVATAADAAKDLALTLVRDSVRTAYNAGKAAVRDSDATVRHEVLALNDRVARLHRDSVPTVAISPVIDSASRTPSVAIVIGDDSTSYRVHPNVGRWIQVATWRIASDDSVIGAQQREINVRYPALLAQRDGQLRKAELALVSYDSLDELHQQENQALRRRVAQLTPSRIDKSERIVTYALAVYGAVEGGRRLFGK